MNMENRSNTQAPLYFTSEKSSPAYSAVKDEWPKIVTAAIDDVHRTSIFCTDEAKATEGKRIVANLASLKYEIQHNRHLTLLPDDGLKAIKDYNTVLEASEAMKWFDAPWLFAECYLYRRIYNCFYLSTHWKTYDVFARQKLTTLHFSWPIICDVVRKFDSALVEVKDVRDGEEDNENKEAIFEDLCSSCVRSNATQLSSLLASTSRDTQALASTESPHSLFSAAYKILQASPNRTISFLLSKTPFPLVPTLLLCTFLLKSKLTTKITLHAKPIPWNSTDATTADIQNLLSALADPESVYLSLQDHFSVADTSLGGGNDAPQFGAGDQENLESLAKQIRTYIETGVLTIKEDTFWTSPYGFSDLPRRGLGIWSEFLEAGIVVFVGQEGLGWRRITSGKKEVEAEEMVEAWRDEGWDGKLLFLGGGQRGGLVKFLDGSNGYVGGGGNLDML